MSPEMLLREFDAVAEAPDGVQRLRDLILQLAVRGKLVPFGGAAPSMPLKQLLDTDTLNGISTKPNNDPPGVPVLRISAGTSRTDAVVDEGDVRYLEVDDDTIQKFRLEPGDLLACRFNGNLQYVGKFSLYLGYSEGPRLYPDKLIRFRMDRGRVDPAYVRYAMNSADLRHEVEALCATTAGNIGLSATKLKAVPIPVPVLDVQRRIVEKVDQLMALCDELEERQRRRVRKRDRLNRSALHHLTTAADDGELTHQWARIRENFGLLYDAPETVTELRQAVLQLAVRGKLVPQDPSDEPASVLLERIEAEKRRLHAEGKIGKPKKLPAIALGEVPFGVPEGWEWVRIGTAIELVNGRAFKPSDWTSQGLPIIRIQNLNDESAPFNRCDFAVKDKFLVSDEDLLISWSGTPGTSFGAFVWRRGPAVLNQHIFRCEIFGGVLQNDFARIAVNARLDEMIGQAHGGVGLRHITKGKLENLPIVLPPLPEQRRIVEKVDQLMALCDELEAKLTRARTKSERLAAAVVHQLTAA